jgi:hypothetical protein
MLSGVKVFTKNVKYQKYQFLVSHRNNTWGQCYKTLHGRTLRLFIMIPGKPFLPSLMFVGKARAYPSDATKAPALPANIRLGWKGLPRTNALAYYQKAQLRAVKSFITLVTDNS